MTPSTFPSHSPRNLYEALHQEALTKAKSYRTSELELLDVLSRIDDSKAFIKLGFSSLHVYCTTALLLSDAQSYALISISRKSKEIPELKKKIEEGELSVSNARRLIPVLTPSNQEEWLEKGSQLTQRELEKEIVRAHPDKAIPKDSIKPLTTTRSKLTVVISPELEKELRRVQDILSQKGRRAVTLEEALQQMTTEFVSRHDPIKKAERVCARATKE